MIAVVRWLVQVLVVFSLALFVLGLLLVDRFTMFRCGSIGRGAAWELPLSLPGHGRKSGADRRAR
jgi:hypothetical protein